MPEETKKEPIGKILASAGRFVIIIRFETRESAIEYAKQHGINARDMRYEG